MDFEAVGIGGVGVILLILGIVEAAKVFGVKGKASQATAAGLGFLLIGIASATEAGVIPAAAIPYIEIVIKGLGGAVAAMGIFDLLKKRLTPQLE